MQELMGFSVHLRIHNLTGYQRTGYSRVNGYCSGGSKLVAVKTLLGLSLVADLIHCYMFTFHPCCSTSVEPSNSVVNPPGAEDDIDLLLDTGQQASYNPV
ncbi:hypothetical protein Tco_0881638 [Tanacetum coccineum]